jgi:hypothetical protein
MPSPARRNGDRSSGCVAEMQQTGTLEADLGSSRSVADGCDVPGGQLPHPLHRGRRPPLSRRAKRSRMPFDIEARGEEGVAVRLPLHEPRIDPGRDRRGRRGGRLGTQNRGGGSTRRVLRRERASRSSGVVLLEMGCAALLPRRRRRRSDDPGGRRRLESGLRGRLRASRFIVRGAIGRARLHPAVEDPQHRGELLLPSSDRAATTCTSSALKRGNSASIFLRPLGVSDSRSAASTVDSR